MVLPDHSPGHGQRSDLNDGESYDVYPEAFRLVQADDIESKVLFDGAPDDQKHACTLSFKTSTSTRRLERRFYEC
jgi:hypothetical protein